MSAVTGFKPHLSLNVRNVDASVNFYRALFGVDPVKHYHDRTQTHSLLLDDSGADSRRVRTGYAKFDLNDPPLNFVLNEMADAQPGGSLSHLGLQVADSAAVLRLRERALAVGMAPRDEMAVSCCYARQDKFWLADPDGNEWEVFAVLEHLSPEQLRATGEQCAASACVSGAAAAPSADAATDRQCGCVA